MGVAVGLGAAIAAALVFLFSVSQGLKTPESAQCYGGKIFVSNIGNLPPDAKDGDGYISLLSEDGKILKDKFITGLNAPKGITFCDGKLFVADIDRVVVADPQSGKVIKSIPVEGARFLNDTASHNGKVFVSDTQTNTIYAIDAKTYKVSVFLKSHKLQGPNGLAFTKDGKLLVVSWGGGKLLEIDKGIKTLASGFENLDGVVVADDGSIYFSDFSAGKIYRYKDGKVFTVAQGLTSPADIGYCKGKRELLIPEFLMNDLKVMKVEE
ncbi:Vgb family protein [Thermovibrio sp.]